MKRLFTTIAALAVLGMSSTSFGLLLVDMTLDSTTSAYHENIDGYVIDDILAVEVAEKEGWSGWLYWDVPTFVFGPKDFSQAEVLDLHVRYHQEDYPDRTAYSDAGVWFMLEDNVGTLQDIGWCEAWTQDEWKHQTKDLSEVVWDEGFDETKVVKLWVRSTNWGAPEDLELNFDYLHFEHLSVTVIPEPSTIAMFGLGLMSLLALRRRK